MNSLRAVEAALPPGFRFQPRDVELICDYLMKRVAGCTPDHTPFLIQLDLNTCEPWDIPEVACVGGKAWYFYSQRDKKYATGLRTNRATLSGYWKATGKDRPVTHEGILVGMRKTLVFYQGRAPKGTKTAWVMHEFRLEWKFGPGHMAVSCVQECTREDWVLCRVFQKNTPHPPKQHTEPGFETSSSSPPISLPPSMEPYNKADPFQANYYHKHHEQVPCFSCFNINPCQSLLLTHPEQQILPTNVTPNFAGLTHNLGGICYHKSDPSCDENVIQAGLGPFTKMESFDNDSCVQGSSCFGERKFSESYLSPVWNWIPFGIN
ncbi:NAC domain-containing protein 21/22-like [Primulina eburnea]|uniref:NAC domain-containing protein 21/22-like n=1 Tax=Primulina eburnea TaxID=1245227 RepID=UPI003C6C3739